MEARYEIFEANLERVTALVERLNKRAAKLGVEPVRLAVLRSWKVKEVATLPPDLLKEWILEDTTPEPGMRATGRLRGKVEIEIAGTEPILDGWTFLAALESAGEAGNLLRAVPGKEVPEKYRTADATTCDHCGLKRKRTTTFVLRHESGETKQVGSTCLADFLARAAQDPHAVAEAAELWYDLGRAAEDAGEWAEEHGGRPREEWAIEHVLAVTRRVIRAVGWVSRTASQAAVGGGCSTRDDVSFVLTARLAQAPERERARVEMLRNVEAEDEIEATEAVEWAKALGPDGLSDYEWNLRAVARTGVVTQRTMGIAVSLLPAYRRAVGREIERKKAAAESRHQGEVGKRTTFTGLTVTGIFDREGPYGVTRIHKFVDAAGNRFTWFASGDTRLKEGETYDVKATVKRHEEWKGIRETHIARAVATLASNTGAERGPVERA